MHFWDPEKAIYRGSRVPVVSLGDSINVVLDAFRSGKLDRNRIYELRYDLMGGSEEGLRGFLEEVVNSGIRYIFTYRGETDKSLRIYRSSIEAGATLIDLDLRVARQLSNVRTKKIVSFHGSFQEARRLIPEMLDLDPLVIKIAPKFSSLQEFLGSIPEVNQIRKDLQLPLCYSPMGTIPGMRFFSCIYLSDMCYVSWKKPTAEGQPTMAEYDKFIQLVHAGGSDHI